MNKWRQVGTIKDSVILGVSLSHHDGAACLVKDGKILCAIELERLAKIKKLSFRDEPKEEFYKHAEESLDELVERRVDLCIDYLLESTNLIWDDVTFIAIAKDPDSFVIDHKGPKVVDLSDRWFDEKRSFIIPDCFLNGQIILAHIAVKWVT